MFHLHHSFAEPVREVLHQPFELTETGWGEFEITAVVHFIDEAMEEPFQMVHALRLFHQNEQPLTTKKPVSLSISLSLCLCHSISLWRVLLKTEVRDRNTDCFTFLYLHIFFL